MRCERCREALSALLDGEDPGVAPVLVDEHLATCVACRSYELRLADLHRVTRVRQAEAVPDLAATITARAAADLGPVPAASGWQPVPHDPVPHDIALGWLRSGLTFVGVLVVLLSAALLVANDASAPAHLAAWDLAFGGALLVAAAKPERAFGLLPMAVLLVVSMTTASVIEINDGHPASHGLVFHLAELLGVVLLALLARHVRPSARRERLPLS
jgi:predicted anti-sigma-YlaC factor YlaD